MKKIILFYLLVFSAAGKAIAQEEADTLVIDNPNKVVVKSDSSSMMVEIFGKKDNPDYHFKKEIEVNQGVNVLKESNSDLDFKLPFSKSTERTRRGAEFIISPCLSFGMVSALGGPEQLKTNFTQSFEITWHMAWLKLYPGNQNWSYSTGLWFNWKNYRMTDDTRFDLDDSNVILTNYPDHANHDFSRVHLLSWQVPLMVHYQTTNRRFKFGAGILFNFNGHGNLKTRYTLDGQKYKDHDKGVHLNSMTTDIIGVASYKNYFGLYAKYSPMNVLDTNHGPKFHGFSVGLIFDF